MGTINTGGGGFLPFLIFLILILLILGIDKERKF